VSFDDVFADAPAVKTVMDAFRERPSPGIPQGLKTVPPRHQRLESVGHDCDMIVPNLYVGSDRAVCPAVIHAFGITHVVRLSSRRGEWPLIDFAQSHEVFQRDVPFAELTLEFWDALEFVSNAIAGGGVVLLHCTKGISRSPILCIAYLIEKLGYTFQTASKLLTQQRPCVVVDPVFAQQVEWHLKQKK
jgi:hypothetical protein